MDEITIVKKRTRIWPILLTLRIIAVLVLVVLYIIGARSMTTVGWNDIVEYGRRSARGTA